jgi:hypothetical protein
MFIGNGFFICRIAYGHMDFLPFLTLPLALWALHQSLDVAVAPNPNRVLRLALLVLLMAAAVSIGIDGSPVSIIHLLVWIALYALVLSVIVRSPRPLVILALALGLATFLSAGYLWPMLEAQAAFPRRTPDTFTNPLALAWFALLPLRGKLITPATGNGHELSVFVGPVVGYAIWRFRATITDSIPRQIKWPLCIVSVICIWLGMGSLRVLHVPTLLSPYDWLRPLPGFRSLWVTGRFWGFLTLPLSLLGAAALTQFVTSDVAAKNKKIALGCAVALQFGFQIVTIYSLWSDGHPYRALEPAPFAAAGETIRYTLCDRQHYQGEFIAPTQGVVNCYDNDDFIRVQFEPGAALLKMIETDDGQPLAASAQASFISWNHIRVTIDAASVSQSFIVVLNQAYNEHWSSRHCAVQKYTDGFLSMRCPTGMARYAIDLSFEDALSTRAANISLIAWKLWAIALGVWCVAWGLRTAFVLRRGKRIT